MTENKEINFRQLANQLMFDLSEEETERIREEFETLQSQLALLDVIDTDAVDPMVFPFEEETVYMRPDVPDHVITQEEALANVTQKVEGHFVLPKVVK